MHPFSVQLCLLAASAVTAASLPCRSESRPVHLPVRNVASLTEIPSFLERIIRRPNGDFLVTQLEKEGQLWLLKNAISPDAHLTALHNFAPANGVAGIAAVAEDTYIVMAQQFYSFLDAVPNTTTIWEIEFPAPFSDNYVLRKAASIPSAGFLNGMATLPQYPTVALLGDSFNGQVVRLDVNTGKYETVLDVPELHASAGAAFPVGINGLQIHNGYMYWSNTARVGMYRIAINEHGYPRNGSQTETLAIIAGISGIDDFRFDKLGNIWSLANLDNQVFVLEKGLDPWSEYHTYQFVAGGLNSSEIPGPTDCAWGVGEQSHILYATTSGGSKAPINGTYVEPAKVAAVDTTAFFQR
ncbi:hypothetical protein F5Y16DRAFT_184541 [Xylariaceae sp. FL0255]|nr:hypothetical protein F5Y16DRAFT_184541 [Xylariaceae sp. FL0255]